MSFAGTPLSPVSCAPHGGVSWRRGAACFGQREEVQTQLRPHAPAPRWPSSRGRGLYAGALMPRPSNTATYCLFPCPQEDNSQVTEPRPLPQGGLCSDHLSNDRHRAGRMPGCPPSSAPWILAGRRGRLGGPEIHTALYPETLQPFPMQVWFESVNRPRVGHVQSHL